MIGHLRAFEFYNKTLCRLACDKLCYGSCNFTQDCHLQVAFMFTHL